MHYARRTQITCKRNRQKPYIAISPDSLPFFRHADEEEPAIKSIKAISNRLKRIKLCRTIYRIQQIIPIDDLMNVKPITSKIVQFLQMYTISCAFYVRVVYWCLWCGWCFADRYDRFEHRTNWWYMPMSITKTTSEDKI